MGLAVAITLIVLSILEYKVLEFIWKIVIYIGIFILFIKLIKTTKNNIKEGKENKEKEKLDREKIFKVENERQKEIVDEEIKVELKKRSKRE